MKNLLFKGTIILILFVTASFTGIDETGTNLKMIGSWEYNAPDAPYEYQEGDIHFLMQNDKLVGFIEIDGYKTELENIIVKGNNLTCELYVEGESVILDLKFKKKSFKGTATYSEGTLDFSGKKK
jgi:hypothetical protein